MQYLIYFAVATPLLLGALFYEAATLPKPGPLFSSGYEEISTQPSRQLAAAPVTAPTSKKFARNEAPSTE